MIIINLKKVPVSSNLAEYEEIKSLFYRAFPKIEQLPMWLLRALTIRKTIDFLAYYDDNSLCGISYTVNSDDLVFVFYLAVNDKIRSKGYGSAILQCIKDSFLNKVIALNIEPLDIDSDNYNQRVRRYQFYLKNGFIDTKYQMKDSHGCYQILATTDTFSVDDYKKVFKQLSLGFYSPQVNKQMI